MTPAGGHWVRVRFSDASTRLDWIPADQPAAPDGRPGAWHVVPDPAGGPSRWEWHPGSSPLAVAASGEQALPPPVDQGETQPLPLQAVPNRPRRNPAPLSVHAHPERGGSRPVLPPLGMRWAAGSLSVVLAVSLVYLLARHSDNDEPSRISAQSGLESSGIGTTSTSPESTSSEATAAGDEAVDRYLQHLFELDTSQGYTFAALGGQYLLTIGTEACGALDGGVSYEAERESVMRRVPNGGQLVVASAATYLCPQHHAKLQEFADGSHGTSAQGSTGESDWDDDSGDTAQG